jgi:hypothetical protein
MLMVSYFPHMSGIFGLDDKLIVEKIYTYGRMIQLIRRSSLIYMQPFSWHEVCVVHAGTL